MARYTGPKDKLSRREGFDIFSKGRKLTRLTQPPGQHGLGRTKVSEYGRQLRKKQLVKRIYGVSEKQFRHRYLNRAHKQEGEAAENLMILLEKRLDNAIYRAGFAKTRPHARQLVTQGHVSVNEQRVDVPSFEISPDDVITLSATALGHPNVMEAMQQEDTLVPSWLGRVKDSIKIIRDPSSDDLTELETPIEIIEFYSR